MIDQSNSPEEPEITQPETLEVEPSEPENKHRREILRGIRIFIGLYGLLFLVSQIFTEYGFGLYLGWLAMLVNLILLIYFARYRKGAAGGMLGAFASMIVLAFIILPIFWLALYWFNWDWWY
jgi:hypothetical protein